MGKRDQTDKKSKGSKTSTTPSSSAGGTLSEDHQRKIKHEMWAQLKHLLPLSKKKRSKLDSAKSSMVCFSRVLPFPMSEGLEETEARDRRRRMKALEAVMHIGLHSEQMLKELMTHSVLLREHWHAIESVNGVDMLITPRFFHVDENGGSWIDVNISVDWLGYKRPRSKSDTQTRDTHDYHRSRVFYPKNEDATGVCTYVGDAVTYESNQGWEGFEFANFGEDAGADAYGKWVERCSSFPNAIECTSSLFTTVQDRNISGGKDLIHDALVLRPAVGNHADPAGSPPTRESIGDMCTKLSSLHIVLRLSMRCEASTDVHGWSEIRLRG